MDKDTTSREVSEQTGQAVLTPITKMKTPPKNKMITPAGNKADQKDN